jgi:peptidoglycan/LPS O-acetylase OafA/YrhL
MPPGRPPDAPNRAARIPGDDGVPAIAAASVLVFHYWWYGADARASADGHRLGRSAR